MPAFPSLRSLQLLAFAAIATCATPFGRAADTPPTPAHGTSMAAFLLKQLNEREQEAYKRYEIAIEASDVHRVRQELQAIIDEYNSIISQAPNFAPAYVSFGLMLNRTGNREESYTMFLKADELDPMLPVVKNQLGNYMAEEGKYQEALGFYMLAHDLDPKQSLYDYQIGQILVAYRKFFIDDKLFNAQEIDEQIVARFKRAMKNSPNETAFRMRYAQSFFDVDNPDWEEALEAWQVLYKFAGTDKERQLVRLYTARVRYEMGHFGAARKLLKQIDDPELEESKRTIAQAIDTDYPR